MVVLGILLLVAALALLAFVLLGGLPPGPDNQVSLEVFGLTLDTTAVAVFALGALTLLLLELAVLCIRSGARKSARRRAELQRLRRVEAEVQSRQAAEAQRNAAAEPSYTAPATPFARREPTERPAGGTDDTPEVQHDRGDPGAHGKEGDDMTGSGEHRDLGRDENRSPERRSTDVDGTGAGTAVLATPPPTPAEGGSSAAASHDDADRDDSHRDGPRS